MHEKDLVRMMIFTIMGYAVFFVIWKVMPWN